MTNFTRFMTAAAVVGLAAPAGAQYYPQQQYPQGQYPGQYQYPQGQYQPQYQQQYGYGQQGYGTTGNPVTDIIDQLLGNRYNVTDRQAVRQCANAARAQAAQQYGGYGNNAYGNNGYGQQGYGQQGYGQGYNRGYNSNLRVTAITNVERRSNGLRVSGLMSSGYGASQYGNQYGYQNGGNAAGNLSFRCNVDYRGAVTGIRIRPGGGYGG